jgi:hypothetical protein
MAVTQRVLNCKNQKIKALISSTLLTAADTNKIVTTTNMKVGTYSIDAQPASVPTLVTVTTTAGGTADTQGIITVTGTDIFDRVLVDVITPVAGTTVTGTKYFKTITTVVGSGWVINPTGPSNDTIIVGVPASIGIAAKGYSISLFVITGNVWINPTTTAVADTTSIPLIAGDAVENLTVADTLSLISDGSGGTFYAIVWDVVPRPC